MRRFQKASQVIRYTSKKIIFEVKISLKSHSTSSLTGILSKTTSDLRLLQPKRVKLQIFWSPSNLTLDNRLALRKFMTDLKKMNIGFQQVNLPFCLPGWKDYEKIKRFASFPECDSCIFKKGNRCPGLIPSSFHHLFKMRVKDFSNISLDDFKDEKEPLTWWIPRRRDIEKIIKLAEFLHQGKGLPEILDVGCGQGFLAYLLARTEKANVIGIDPNQQLIEGTRFEHKNLTLLTETADSFLSRYQGSFDLVISSFMPYQLDYTATIKRTLKPKAVLYIEDRWVKKHGYWLNLEISEEEGKFEYSLNKDTVGQLSLNNYGHFQKWSVPSISDLKKKKLYPLSSQIEIQLRKDIHPLPELKGFSRERYYWETELEFFKGKGRITIGDITLALPSREFVQVNNLYSRFHSFRRPDIEIKVHSGLIPNFKHKRKVFDSKGPWMLYRMNGKEVICLSYQNHLERVMVSSHHYKKVDLYLKSGAVRLENILGYPLGEILIINLLSQGRGLLIHSCGIDNNGEGVLFAGSSGAGKSTIASLGINKKGIEVLSDDRVIARKVDGRFWIYGTPWHGHVKVCSPERVPLEKIFFLKHAKKNRIEEIVSIEATSRLIVCSFPTFWDKKGMEFTLKFCAELARKVPCYELGFVPDESVLDFVRDI